MYNVIMTTQTNPYANIKIGDEGTEINSTFRTELSAEKRAKALAELAERNGHAGEFRFVVRPATSDEWVSATPYENLVDQPSDSEIISYFQKTA